jgi:hypothetical protein
VLIQYIRLRFRDITVTVEEEKETEA